LGALLLDPNCYKYTVFNPPDEHDPNSNAQRQLPTYKSTLLLWTGPLRVSSVHYPGPPSAPTVKLLLHSFPTVYAPTTSNNPTSLRTLVTTPASLQAATSLSQLHHVARQLDEAVDVAELVCLRYHWVLGVAVLVHLVVMLKADRGAKVA